MRQDARADHRVEAARRERQRSRIGLAKQRARQAVPRDDEHPRAQIDAHRLAIGLLKLFEIPAGPTAYVEKLEALGPPAARARQRIANPGKFMLAPEGLPGPAVVEGRRQVIGKLDG